jgi:hypothetical protein
MPNTNQTKEMTMSTIIDYTKLAATLDYAALEKKLEQLTQRDPPRKRKTIDLHSKGWGASQLADELKTAGVTVSPARLRECLNCWAAGGDGVARGRTRRRPKRAAANSQPAITAGQSGRGNELQTGQRVTTR